MPTFKKVTEADVQAFQQMMEVHRIFFQSENLASFASDHTEQLSFLPEIVVQPCNTNEVSQILAYCNAQNIPVTVRGAGTGLSGGCLPVMGGLVMDMKLMNKIIHIDTDNFQVITEPGVITEVLQNEVAAVGLFYPVDPASRGSCFIGGNVAENAGGPRAVKYGTTQDFVLNLEIVLAEGSIIWTGANTLKNATGYALTPLIVGSEGTLAVVTKIVLKLLPLPRYRKLLLASFTDFDASVRAINALFLAGFQVSVLEWMEQKALQLAQDYLQEFSFPITTTAKAYLLIEIDGKDESLLQQELEDIYLCLQNFAIENVWMGDSEAQQQKMWKVRRAIGLAVKSASVYKEEDAVVPRAKLPELVRFVKELGQKYGFESVCYGHTGDGNLHINILKNDMSQEQWENELPLAIRALFGFVHSLGGTISGEHGIGWVQKNYMDLVFSPAALDLMRNIKQVFDPKGILNPGKIFPDKS